MDDQRRHYLEKRREKSEAQLKKLVSASGRTRESILSDVIKSKRLKPYIVKGPH